MTKLQDLAQRQMAKLATDRERNRAEAAAHGMGCVAEWVDLLRAGGFKHATPAHIEAPDGWTIGKRDPGPWIDWTLIERAKRWNDRVYGREAVQPDAAPKRRGMTDAQRACLRGDV